MPAFAILNLHQCVRKPISCIVKKEQLITKSLLGFEAIQDLNPRYLVTSIHASSNNLTSLYLDRCGIQPENVIESTLNSCPLLVELYYKRHTDTKFSRCSQKVVIRKNRLVLRKLLIDLGNEYQESNSFLPDILQKGPNLQLLVWNPADHINHDSIFYTLHTYCPHLQRITNVQKDDDQENMDHFVSFSKHYVPPKSGQQHQGLTFLDISHGNIAVETSALVNLFQRHQSTLKTIMLPSEGQLFQQALMAMQCYPPINVVEATFGVTTASYSADDNIPQRTIQSTLYKIISSWKYLKSINLSYYTGNTLGALEILVHLNLSLIHI